MQLPVKKKVLVHKYRHMRMLASKVRVSRKIRPRDRTPGQHINSHGASRCYFCSVRSQVSDPSSGPSAVSSTVRTPFMCIPICGCSWKERSLAGLLPLPATIRRSRSCPGTPISAGVGWQICSVHWHNGRRKSRERSKSKETKEQR